MAKLLCLCLLAVAASVGAYSGQSQQQRAPLAVQTLPAKLDRYETGGKGGGGNGRVQTLIGRYESGIPSQRPQVQQKPAPYNIPKLKPITRPVVSRPYVSQTRPVQRPSGSYTRPRPRPSKGGSRYRRSLDSDEDSDEEYGRYRRFAAVFLEDDDDSDEYDYDDDDF